MKCIYPNCLFTECLHGVSGEPYCQRRKHNPRPDYTKIVGFMLLIAIWCFIAYCLLPTAN